MKISPFWTKTALVLLGGSLSVGIALDSHAKNHKADPTSEWNRASAPALAGQTLSRESNPLRNTWRQINQLFLQASDETSHWEGAEALVEFTDATGRPIDRVTFTQNAQFNIPEE